MRFSSRRAGLIATLVILGLVGVVVYGCNQRINFPSSTPKTTGQFPGLATPSTVARPTRITAASPPPGADPTAVPVTASPTPGPSTVYLPVVGNGAPGSALAPAAATPTTVPSPVATPVPATPPPTPTPLPTRGPIRITKLGLGVYTSGGAMLPVLDESRPSVILLMNPSVDFAKQVRKRFPKAFLVGRIYATSQPLDHPEQRGTAFADRVAATAVPLKGIVDAWMSYNEVASSSDPSNMIAYNTFQIAFAHRLQDHYGIPAVAGNDGPRSVSAEDYTKYFAGAIEASRYFGVHSYPNPDITSLRDPAAADQVFYYRKIHAALQAAGIKSGPFIITEIGLYNGWRGVTSDTSMAQDFTWVADQMNNDPYVIGMAVFGLFGSDRSEWHNFNIAGSDIPRIMGDYNTVQ